MTRIAYILKMYPRFSETFIVNEILELERQGIEVRIYALMRPNDGRFHASLARVRASVVYVPEFPLSQAGALWRPHKAVFGRNRKLYLNTLKHAATRGHTGALKRFLQAGFVAAHLAHHPVDALHAHFASSATRVANYVSRLTGIPYSFTAHAKDIFHEEVNAATLRSKIRDARFVVTVSDFNRDYLNELMGPVRSDVRRLYNGIDLDLFKATSDVARDERQILAVGRLVEKKGFGDLLLACKVLVIRGVDFRCEIIGQGPLEATLRAEIERLELKDRVALIGPRPQDEVLQAYRRSAIFALPCIIGADGNRDGLPTVLLEAMATGTACVSTDVTGVPEIIDHDVDGLVVPQNNPNALADALERLLVEPALRERFAIAGRAKVERDFDVRQSVGTLRQWLSETGAPEPVTLPVEAAPAAIMVEPS